ncbi:hypothetical protein Pint_27659 [Pistacia integerrima]|uniref:Uncharacterized protein n=1 Tax=Pistacia integerrima TaxID=434235 RepID=A0ACC0YUT7_9ROSI|nr:hypothetical protein Pint_27659 [Pistacia integerrima]
METLTRDQYVYMAKLAEQAERYEETVNFMESLVSRDFLCFSNHLSVAYKNVIGSHRSAWQIISSIDLNEESRRTMTTWRCLDLQFWFIYLSLKEIAMAELPPIHPIKLGLALNFSVFYYEILNSSEKACNMGKQVCPVVPF